MIESRVNRGELDIGFVVLPAANTLETELIYQEEFVVCVSSHHRLAGAETVSLSQLKDEKFILFDKSFALYKLIWNHCVESGFSPDVAFQSTQWDLVLELVSEQLGITIIPKKLVNKLNDIDIKALPIKEPKLLWNVGIITKKSAYKSYALKEFINVVREVYKTKI